MCQLVNGEPWDFLQVTLYLYRVWRIPVGGNFKHDGRAVSWMVSCFSCSVCFPNETIYKLGSLCVGDDWDCIGLCDFPTYTHQRGYAYFCWWSPRWEERGWWNNQINRFWSTFRHSNQCLPSCMKPLVEQQCLLWNSTLFLCTSFPYKPLELYLFSDHFISPWWMIKDAWG